ncbi:hypothetical protein C8255_02925 [filamentous cyanobacterium CCP3]|nr:hypothetical protein C8255_02925 [filamentous cyanobacterium CCP3]
MRKKQIRAVSKTQDLAHTKPQQNLFECLPTSLAQVGKTMDKLLDKSQEWDQRTVLEELHPPFQLDRKEQSDALRNATL